MTRGVHKLFFLVLTAALTLGQLSAQQKSVGVPHPLDPSVRLPVIDYSGVLDAKKGTLESQTPQKNRPYLFAFPVKTAISPLSEGVWKTAGDGTRIWTLLIRCKEATSLSFIFGRYQLEEGEKLYIYDPSGSTLLGAFTEKNNKPSGSLAVVPLKGNSAVIQWEVPASHTVSGKLELSQVGLGYRDIFKTKEVKDQFYNSSGACNVDITCPEGEGWEEEKNSVVRIFINGTSLCTGVLMNTVSNDATPYVLTAGHCIADSASAANSIFVFGYESPYCNGPDGSTDKSISGAVLKARGSSLDFSLVEMSQVPPFTFYPYYAGWNTTTNPPNSSFLIHHPNADVKKISIDADPPGISGYDVYDNNTFWWIKQWDVGTSEPGSSGAPLFDQQHRVIGTLSGGDAHCGSSINDYVQMLHYTWDAYPSSDEQVKYWLDPDQLGFSLWNGYDPYVAVRKSCDTLSNIQDNEILTLYEWDGEDAGYRTGHNLGRINEYAEVFYNSEYFSISGLYIMPGMIKYNSAGDKVTIKIWDYDTKPGNVLFQKDFPMSYFQDSVWNFIDFEQLIPIEGNFFAGYEIYYDSPTGPLTDQFAVMQAQSRITYGENFAYYCDDGLWTTFSGTPPDYIYTSLAIQPVVCPEMPDAVIPPRSGQASYAAVSLYPNPARDNLTLTFPNPVHGTSQLFLTDLTGKIVFSKPLVVYGQEKQLSLPPLQGGVYLLRISTDDTEYRAKLIIRDF